MEEEQLSIEERIANLQAIITVAEYEIALLLKQQEYKPVGFTYGPQEKGQQKKTKKSK